MFGSWFWANITKQQIPINLQTSKVNNKEETNNEETNHDAGNCCWYVRNGVH